MILAEQCMEPVCTGTVLGWAVRGAGWQCPTMRKMTFRGDLRHGGLHQVGPQGWSLLFRVWEAHRRRMWEGYRNRALVVDHRMMVVDHRMMVVGHRKTEAAPQWAVLVV